MSISNVHPHDARVTELKLLVATILLGLGLIALILWLGMGQTAPSKIPGVSYLEVVQWNLQKINPFFIPLAITVAVGMSAIVTNSTFYERGLNVTGYSPGETCFIIIGTWIGASWAMSINPDGMMMYTRQELTTMTAGLGTFTFAIFAMMTRDLR